MNYEKIYKSYVRSVFSDECHDIVRTIMYLQKRFYKMPKEFQNANRELSDEAKNKIIKSILQEDDLAKEYKLCRI
ncbi:hypothetical protein CBP76_05055 [Companilactobacillus nuruki]|uniref:Uncharacterized protein n=1 Tax=Companilactobacillus nuruki TaxID=1993540 RepID=A0A2N7AV03_9LACO|nr:hypothetical protein CBP76_05055 [Companilactobacillus nuruki]